MSILSDLHADDALRRHLAQLGILVGALIIAIACAFGVEWLLSHTASSGSAMAPGVSSTSPEELSVKQKLDILNSLSANASGTAAVSGSSSQAGPVQSSTGDNGVSSDDPRVKALESLSNGSSGSNAPAPASGGASTTDSGMSAEDKLKLLQELQ